MSFIIISIFISHIKQTMYYLVFFKKIPKIELNSPSWKSRSVRSPPNFELSSVKLKLAILSSPVYIYIFFISIVLIATSS